MDDVVRTVLMYTLIPGCLGLGTYFMKTLLSRLDSLEREMTVRVDEPKVRQILDDKINPLREDIQEIRQQVQKIYDLLVKRDS